MGVQRNEGHLHNCVGILIFALTNAPTICAYFILAYDTRVNFWLSDLYLACLARGLISFNPIAPWHENYFSSSYPRQSFTTVRGALLHPIARCHVIMRLNRLHHLRAERHFEFRETYKAMLSSYRETFLHTCALNVVSFKYQTRVKKDYLFLEAVNINEKNWLVNINEKNTHPNIKNCRLFFRFATRSIY